MIPQYIIQDYATKQGLSINEAQDIFGKLDLYLAKSRNNNALCPTHIVDDAWHFFILYTREYGNYCKNRFGAFIHHVPGNIELNMNQSVMYSTCSPDDGPIQL